MDLSRASLICLAGAVGGCQTPPTKPDLSEPITVLQRKVVDGQLSSQALVTESLSVIDAEATNNAFITVDERGAMATAQTLDEARAKTKEFGPLYGLPIAIKDNIHVAGLPNTGGTPALRNFVPTEDATVVRRLRNAGAVIVGKTNLHELAYGITSNNGAFGPVRNAYNPDYFAGGSSGGTAAAIATGAVVAGLGSDTGGSSRIPAALNGLVGFRPTVGRYPSDGLTSISNTRDTVGPMGNSVADVVLLDQILSDSTPVGANVDITTLRLGVPRDYFYAHLDPEIEGAMNTLLENLSAAGVTLVEFEAGDLGALNGRVGFPVVLFETGVLVTQYLADCCPDISLERLAASVASPDVKGVFESILAGAVTEEQYQEALTIHRPALQEAYRSYFEDNQVDAIIFPTTPLPAGPIEGSLDPIQFGGEEMPTFAAYIRNTDPGSNAGIPGLSIPLAFTTSGLPFGVEIDGPQGSDDRLLAIGMALEAVIQGQDP